VNTDSTGPAQELLSSTDPAGGAWTGGQISQSLEGLSCASSTLCAATDSAGHVLTSTDPSDPTSWSAAPDTFAAGTVSCPSSTLCLAGTPGGLVVSTGPGDVAQPWTPIVLPGAPPMTPGLLACGGPQLCVAETGTELDSASDPALSSSWTGTPAPPSSDPAAGRDAGAACAGVALCVLGEAGPEAVLVSGTAAEPASFARRPLLGPPHCLSLTTCVTERLLVHDAAGTSVVDTTSAGPGGVIAGVALAAGSSRLTWTDDGQPRSLQLR
jgi:hypothetical protein